MEGVKVDITPPPSPVCTLYTICINLYVVGYTIIARTARNLVTKEFLNVVLIFRIMLMTSEVIARHYLYMRKWTLLSQLDRG